jgi:2-oxoglutarate ferredoxin oxidoreductase subunit delta
MPEGAINDTQMAPNAVPAPHTRRARGQVIIFGMWCKGCRLCVEFCPTGVLAFDGGERPIVAHPEQCTACHWCDSHCPDLAIVVKRIEG